MNGDLISRSAVIDVIKRHECNTIRIMEGVMELPTAYDVDKVVEQMEERVKNFKSLNSDDKIVDVAIKEIQRDIEIVNSGGVK